MQSLKQKKKKKDSLLSLSPRIIISMTQRIARARCFFIFFSIKFCEKKKKKIFKKYTIRDFFAMAREPQVSLNQSWSLLRIKWSYNFHLLWFFFLTHESRKKNPRFSDGAFNSRDFLRGLDFFLKDSQLCRFFVVIIIIVIVAIIFIFIMGLLESVIGGARVFHAFFIKPDFDLKKKKNIW